MDNFDDSFTKRTEPSSIMKSESAKMMGISRNRTSLPRINSSKLYTVNHSRLPSSLGTARDNNLHDNSMFSKYTGNDSSMNLRSRLLSSAISKKSHVKTI